MRTPKPWALPTQPVTRALLSSSGVSDEMIRTQLRAGRLIRVRQGVYLARDAWPESAADLHVMLARAEQVVNPTAVISHESAAVVWGLPTPGFTPWHASKPSVTLLDKGLHGWSGTATRHEARLPTSDLTRDSDGYTVTTVARTAIDLARPLGLPGALAILDHAARLLITSYVTSPRRSDFASPRLVAAARESLLAAAGHHRSRLRPAVELVVPARESPAESLTAGQIHLSGLPLPLFQAPIDTPHGTVYPDFLWPDLMLIGECDGAVKYTDQQSIVAEKEREQLLRDMGYRIVRWLAKEIMTRPDLVLARIERALLV